MPKVLCPAVECEHYRNGRCTAKDISLIQWEIGTVHEGRKTMWECKKYKVSEEWQRIKQELSKYFGGTDNGKDQTV